MRLIGLEKWFNQGHYRVYFQRKFEAPRVLSNLGIGTNSTCIEIGCGQGAGALLINRYTGCDRLVCVDIDSATIEAARRYIARPPAWAGNTRTDNIQFLCQDAASLSFADCSFDAAFLFGVLHHITGWQKVIAEVYRVLKAGAVFSFEEALFPNSIFSFNNLTGHVPIGQAELRNVVAGSGFSIQHFEITKRFELTSLLPACYIRAVKDRR